MTRPVLIFAPIAAALVAVFGYTSWRAALLWERWEADRLVADLAAAGQGWARVEADGLILRARGAAPDAAALSAAMAVVETRLWSETGFTLRETEAAAALPLEIALVLLRDGDAVTVTGAAPDGATRRKIAALGELGAVEDVSVQAGLPAPEGWIPSLDFALAALRDMPQARIRVRPGAIEIEGAVASAEQRDALEARLRAAKPPACALTLRISAPPPALSPYRFVVEKSGETAEVLACAAESETHRTEIAEALASALGVEADCAVAVGAPSADWPKAVAAGVRAVAALPAGRFEISDNEAQLFAAQPTAPATFDTALRNLALALPASYSLLSAPPPATAPEPVAEEVAANAASAAAPASSAPQSPAKRWFRAVAGPGGKLTLTGEAPDETTRTAILTYARALAGAAAVKGGLSLAAEPAPDGWRRAALSGLEALALLETGEAVFDGTEMRLTGETERPEAVAAIRAALAPKIAEGLAASTEIKVDQTRLLARLPLSPAECVAALAGEVAGAPITFEPGSVEVGAENAPVLDRLAAILKRCDAEKIEIGGHTDSQGRESTNLALSEARADAVLDALLARGVSLKKLVARGYGEDAPIADNGTEEGRARNRRIEFTAAEAVEAAAGDDAEGAAVE